MKKFLFALSALLAITLSGCSSLSEKNSTLPKNVPNVDISVSDSPSVPPFENDWNEETNNPNMNIAEKNNTSGLNDSESIVFVDDINTFEPISSFEDVWDIHFYADHIPFTPDGYDGQVIDYATKCIDSKGQVSSVIYRDVAFFTGYDDAFYDLRDNYRFAYVNIKVDGKNIFGVVFLCESEYHPFLEHYHDGIVDRFPLELDVDSPNSGYVLAQNDVKAIMASGSYVFTYNFKTAQTNLIADAVLNYKYPVEGEFYFTDWNHIEYKVDWEHDDTITITGNKVVAYRNEDFSLSIIDDFEEEFLKIQQDFKDGNITESQYTDKYIIRSWGSVYSIPDNKLVTSIHLPHAYLYNSNLMVCLGDNCCLIENFILNLYRFGDLVRSYELPDGKWRIIGFYEDADILLMNVDDASIYTIDQNRACRKVLSGVVDYYEAFGKLYWMDANGNCYLYHWRGDETNELIAKNIIGFSPRAGFIIKPDTP